MVWVTDGQKSERLMYGKHKARYLQDYNDSHIEIATQVIRSPNLNQTRWICET